MDAHAEFASRLIATGAEGYAAAAAHRLLERHPETAARFGSDSFRQWKEHLTQRLDELAAALLAGDPEFLVAEVVWARVGFAAREVPEEDLQASLECLRDVLAGELPEAAGGEPVAYLDACLAALDGALAPAEPAATAGTPDERLALRYLEAALSGDRRRAANAILGEVEQGLAVTAAFDALMAAQREVGEMWHRFELAIPHEHFVTATTEGVMALLTHRAERAAPVGKTVLVAAVPGNTHDLGARLVACHFEMAGWRAVHLAGPLPVEELALGVEAFEADLLALSMTLSTQLRATLRAVQQARAARAGVKVLVGGRSLVQMPRLCSRIGADACAASAEEAVAAGARLVGLG